MTRLRHRALVTVLAAEPATAEHVVGRLVYYDERVIVEHVLAGARSPVPPRTPVQCHPVILHPLR